MKRLADIVRPPGGPVAEARRLIRRRGVGGAAPRLGLTERELLLVAAGAQAPRRLYEGILGYLLAELKGRPRS